MILQRPFVGNGKFRFSNLNNIDHLPIPVAKIIRNKVLVNDYSVFKVREG